MVYAIFILPRHLRDSQKRLEEKLMQQLDAISKMPELAEELQDDSKPKEDEVVATEPVLAIKKDN